MPSDITRRGTDSFSVVSKSSFETSVLGPDTGGVDPNEDTKREEEARGDVRNSTT